MSFSMLYLHIINDQLESTLSTLNTPTNNNVISGERKGLSTHTVCAITLVRHRSRDTLFDREEREERKRRASGQSEKPPFSLLTHSFFTIFEIPLERNVVTHPLPFLSPFREHRYASDDRFRQNFGE